MSVIPCRAFRSNAAAWLWVPLGTALLRTGDPLEAFGLLSSLVVQTVTLED